MTDNSWLAEWLPPKPDVSTRTIRPSPLERMAVAGAATHFVDATSQFFNNLAEDQDQLPEAAHAAAVTAAVVDDYLSTITEYVDPAIEDDDDPYWDEDEPPESIQARTQLAAAREKANLLTEQAQHLLQQAGLPLRPRSPSRTGETDIQKSNDEYRKLVTDANRAAATGHCAALNWLIDQVYYLNDEDRTAVNAAFVLAMWPHENEIMQLRDADLTDDARQTVDDAVNHLIDYVWSIEYARPAYVTPLADPKWHNGEAQDLVSMFPTVGPESDAMYSWGYDDTDEAIMAYRHRGSTHVKLVREPYSHPIDRREALEHCDSLEEKVSECWEPEEVGTEEAQTYRNLLAMAAANRSLALMGYHYLDQEPFDKAIAAAAQEGSLDQTRRLINAIYDEHAQIVLQKISDLELNHPALTITQTQAAVNAAQEAGASPAAVRRMVAALGYPPEVAVAIKLTEPEPPIPWNHAREIISNVYAEHTPHDPDKWERIVSATGWDPSNPNVELLWEVLL